MMCFCLENTVFCQHPYIHLTHIVGGSNIVIDIVIIPIAILAEDGLQLAREVTLAKTETIF